ncbi:MAG TPA: sialidase family protein [Terriglobales bacterium]|jgi:photosystem II stability/assembly factor-like uncharacterized protein
MIRIMGVSATLLLIFAVGVTLIQVSSDPFTNQNSQHQTELEPDTFAFGSTIVGAFQTGRVPDGGSSDIGWVTSTNGGATWSNGFLPGITRYFQGGTYTAVSDPAVAYDASHNVWMISSLAITNSIGKAVLVSRSTDGGITWGNPVTVNNQNGFADKEWIACDNTSTSPFYGHCYVEWDDAGNGDQVKMSTSTDGGVTWSKANTSSGAFSLGGQPVVQPNGTVVVPIAGVEAFTSTDGGQSWTRPVTVSNSTDHGVAGGLRTSALPSAEVDGAGKVYVVWQDCRFRTGCRSNDIVMSTSTDGRTWSQVTRIPIDPTTSTVDHFIPGIAVDPATSGNTAHLGLTFYFYPNTSCNGSTCQLGVGFVSSQDGGQTWSRPTKVAGPMKLNWLANTTQGRMVGDYISTSYVNGKPFSVFAVAVAPTGSVFNEAMFAPATGFAGLESAERYSAAADLPVPNAKSDHPPRQFYDQEGILPIPPGAKVPPERD